MLKVLLEEVGAHGLEVVSQQLAQAEALCGGQVGFALEDAPAGLFEHRLIAILDEAAGLCGPHVVEGVVHLGDDVEAVEDVERRIVDR